MMQGLNLLSLAIWAPEGGAPGALTSPDPESVKREVAKARGLVNPFEARRWLTLFLEADTAMKPAVPLAAPPSLLFEQPAKPKRPAPAMPAPETAAVPKNERRLKPVWFNLSSDIQLSLIKAVSRLPFRRPSVTG